MAVLPLARTGMIWRFMWINYTARIYGSQGQQRSCALSMKLSEAALIREITGEQPVALLDDVMSELDAGRQDYILESY